MFPPEIRHQIILHFLYPDVGGFPGRAQYGSHRVEWDAFMQLWPAWLCNDFYSGGSLETITCPFYRLKADIYTLCNIRLVSREWLASVEPVLRRHTLLSVDVGSRNDMAKLASVIRSSLPIGRLVIPQIYDALEFIRHYTYGPGHDVEDVIEYKDELIYDGRSPGVANTWSEKPFIGSGHIKLLDAIFNNLPDLESFTLVLPPSSGTYSNGWSGSVEFYDMQVINSCISFFQKTFRSYAFNHLTDLRLHLPCTHNVGQLCEALGPGARSQILHLEICIVDASGVSGQRHHLFFDDHNEYTEMDGDVHIPNSVPYSNLQREFNNQKHQDELWNFIGSCANLQSLHVLGSNFLDLDRLDWRKAPGSRGLRVLSLERVWASFSSLQALLLPSPSEKDARPQLRRISLNDVKIHENGGTWEAVFNHLRKEYPDLELSCSGQLTYFENHPRYLPLQHTCYQVKPGNEKDSRAIYALLKHLAYKVGGWDCLPEACRESADVFDDD